MRSFHCQVALQCISKIVQSTVKNSTKEKPSGGTRTSTEQEHLQNKKILFPWSEIIFLKQQWLRGPGHNFLTGQWINSRKSMN